MHCRDKHYQKEDPFIRNASHSIVTRVAYTWSVRGGDGGVDTIRISEWLFVSARTTNVSAKSNTLSTLFSSRQKSQSFSSRVTSLVQRYVFFPYSSLKVVGWSHTFV